MLNTLQRKLSDPYCCVNYSVDTSPVATIKNNIGFFKTDTDGEEGKTV